jgi:hypothetical protein
MSLGGWAVLGGYLPAEEQPVQPKMTSSAPDRIARWRERLRSISTQGVLPIIDTQASYGPDISTDYMLSQMDRNGVALVCFAPKFTDPRQGSRLSLQLATDHLDYFVPTTCDGNTDYWSRQEGPFLEVIQRETRSGDFFLMGEFEFRHYISRQQTKKNQLWRDIAIPIDGPWSHLVFQLSSATGLAFQIHYEREDALLAPLEKMLQAYPAAKVIWCHTGAIRYPAKQSVYGPDYLSRTLSQHPNLFGDLAVSDPGKPYPGSGFVDNTIQFGDGRLRPEWQKVLEVHSDRFTVGTDIAPGRYSNFPRKIANARRILSALSKEAAERIAFKNAWRLLTKETWSG